MTSRGTSSSSSPWCTSTRRATIHRCPSRRFARSSHVDVSTKRCSMRLRVVGREWRFSRHTTMTAPSESPPPRFSSASAQDINPLLPWGTYRSVEDVLAAVDPVDAAHRSVVEAAGWRRPTRRAPMQGHCAPAVSPGDGSTRQRRRNLVRMVLRSSRTVPGGCWQRPLRGPAPARRSTPESQVALPRRWHRRRARGR